MGRRTQLPSKIDFENLHINLLHADIVAEVRPAEGVHLEDLHSIGRMNTCA